MILFLLFLPYNYSATCVLKMSQVDMCNMERRCDLSVRSATSYVFTHIECHLFQMLCGSPGGYLDLNPGPKARNIGVRAGTK